MVLLQRSRPDTTTRLLSLVLFLLSIIHRFLFLFLFVYFFILLLVLVFCFGGGVGVFVFLLLLLLFFFDDVVRIAHSLGDGKLVSWGAQSHGQLGTGVKANFSLPTVMSSQQRFANLYLALGGVGSGGIVEEVVEESISLGVNKDVLIKYAIAAEVHLLFVSLFILVIGT
jgi:hypothetical protein